MLRLQRVSFLALNQVLGLGKELINQVGEVWEAVEVGKVRGAVGKVRGSSW